MAADPHQETPDRFRVGSDRGSDAQAHRVARVRRAVPAATAAKSTSISTSSFCATLPPPDAIRRSRRSPPVPSTPNRRPQRRSTAIPRRSGAARTAASSTSTSISSNARVRWPTCVGAGRRRRRLRSRSSRTTAEPGAPCARVKDGNGGVDPLMLAESETRYVRLSLHKGQRRYATRCAKSRSSLRIRRVGERVLLRAREKGAARQLSARFHRAALLDHRRRRRRGAPALFSEDGALEPRKGGFSIAPFLIDRRQAGDVGRCRAVTFAARRRSADAVGRVEKWKCGIDDRRVRARHAREFCVARALSRPQHQRSDRRRDARARDPPVPGQSARAIPQFRRRREPDPRSRAKRTASSASTENRPSLRSRTPMRSPRAVSTAAPLSIACATSRD